MTDVAAPTQLFVLYLVPDLWNKVFIEKKKTKKNTILLMAWGEYR